MKSVTAEEIVKGARRPKKPREGVPISQYSVRLVKGKTRYYAASRINDADALARIARAELGHLPHEEVIIIGISGQNEPLGVVKIAQGGISAAGVAPNDIIRSLAIMGATAFFIAHNHPSGDPQPSRDDIALTNSLKATTECAGFHLLDHLIVGGRGGGWKSFRVLGLL